MPLEEEKKNISSAEKSMKNIRYYQMNNKMLQRKKKKILSNHLECLLKDSINIVRRRIFI